MMVNRIILTAIILISLVSNVVAAEMKIGVYNERLVLSKAPQVELIESKLQKQFADRISELKALEEKGKEMQEEGKRNALTMTEEQKIKLNRDLTEIRTSLQAKGKNLNEDSQRAQQAEVNKIRVRIQQIVNKISTDENYDIVLRIEALVFRKEAVDISNKIITVLSNPAG